MLGARCAAAMRGVFASVVAEDRAARGAHLTIRQFAEDPDFCGLELSPAAAAIQDAACGVPVTLTVEACRAIFRCAPDEIPLRDHVVVVVGAGRGGGKTSQLLAPAALHAAWTTPLVASGARTDPRFPEAHRLAPGERPKVLLISSSKRLAKQAYELIVGLIKRSPVLRASLVDEPTSQEAILRRPDGIEVRIEIVAAKAQGESARSGTILFLAMDEACFFRSGETYEVNDTDTFDAAIPRIVAGGRVFIVSTPWIEEEGLLEGFVTSDWGLHDAALVAARIPTRVLNPAWDPTGKIERTIRKGRNGEATWSREILAIPLPKGSKSFFVAAKLRACAARLPPTEGLEAHEAGADLGHTSDASSEVIAQRFHGGIFSIPELKEIETASDQKPSETYRAFTDILVRRGIKAVAGDGHYKKTFEEALQAKGRRFVEAAPADVMYQGAKDVIDEDRLCLGALEPDDREMLIDQMLSVVSKPRPQGGFTIIEPRRRVGADGGTTHADTARAAVVALWRAGSCEPNLWKAKPKVWQPGVGTRPGRASGIPRPGEGGGWRDEWR